LPVKQKPNKVESLVDHLFRSEAGKMVSVLTRIFGLSHIELAEDIVQDTFVKALDDWKRNQIPPVPEAWLYRAAKNKTIDHLRHRKHVEEYASEVGYLLKSEWTLSGSVSNMFLDSEIKDSQLRMIFLSCHPSLPKESQIAFTLKTLCGFSIREIAKSLLTTEANINKRLFRAKQKLRGSDFKFEIPHGAELEKRLDSVYKVIYLLFNEGYSSTDSNSLIRKDLCAEAIRLCSVLTEHVEGDKPRTYALLALMCFHAARLDSRIDDEDFIILLKEQDRSKWNMGLVRKGFEFLDKSAAGSEISEYHIEAGIASYHSSAPNFEETNWQGVLTLYDMLAVINPSPVTSLNRAIAIAQIKGYEKALDELLKIKGLESYHLYHTTLGEFYLQLKKFDLARTHFNKALKLTGSKQEKDFIKQKIENLEKA